MINFKLRINHEVAIVVVILLGLSFNVRSQTTPDGSMPQFLFPNFTPGRIKMKNGQDQSIMLNYNTVSERLVYEKDGALFDLVNADMVDTAYLQEKKFIPAGKTFQEVLLVAPISLLIQYKGNLLPPGTPAGYGGTSQTSATTRLTSIQLASGYYNLKLPVDYIVNVDKIYWLKRNFDTFSFLNERQFLKIFPENEKELKDFIRKNKVKFERAPTVVKLIEYCNQIIH
jgi:hypothetical protein